MAYASGDALLHTLAQTAKEERKKIGLTQAQLAGKAGVSVDVIRRIEQGREVKSISLLLVMESLKLYVSTADSGMKLARIKEILNE